MKCAIQTTLVQPRRLEPDGQSFFPSTGVGKGKGKGRGGGGEEEKSTKRIIYII